MMLPVLLRRGEELVEGDEDHDPGDHGEEDPHHRVVEKIVQKSVADQRPHRLGEAGEEGVVEGLALAACGVIDGDGDGDPLGDVVDGDSQGDGNTDGGIGEGGGEGRQPLGEVVDGDGQGGEGPHAQQLALALGRLGPLQILDPLQLVGVLDVGDELVDEGDEGNAAEKGDDGEPVARLHPVGGDEGGLGLDEDLDQGDVDHHTGGKAEGEGEELGVGLFREKGNGAADAGRKSGEEGQAKGEEDIVGHGEAPRMTVKNKRP